MKKLIVLIACITMGKCALAQKDSLAFDEHGKYIYYKAINLAGISADTMYSRGQHFFKSAYPKSTLKLIAADAKNYTFAGGGFFLVSKQGLVTKHDDGQIAYTLKVEIKDYKYRYWLTGFVFTPYYKDRFNNYVPQKGMELPLETAAKNLDKKDLDHYLDECAAFAKRLGDKLKIYMEKRPIVKKDTEKKVISIDKW